MSMTEWETGIHCADKQASQPAIQDSLDVAASCQVQQLDIIDNRKDCSPSRVKNLGQKGKPREVKKISKEVDGSYEEKIKAKCNSELHIKKLHSYNARC